jgi:DNA mismatch repair protein MutS
VVTRARQILTRLEISGSLQEKIRNKIPKENQMSLFEKKPDPVLSALKEDLEKIDINNLTPVAALNALQKLKEKLSDHE